MDLSWKQTTWYVFHTFTLNYLPQYKEHYKNFFNSFRVILPCEVCLNHYNMQLMRPELSLENNINEENIFSMTIKIHNNVNISHRKKIWSIEEARNYYSEKINPNLIKVMVLELVRANFKKGPIRNNELFIMLKSMCYIYPKEETREKLINISGSLTNDNIRDWLLEFLKIIFLTN